MKENEIALLEWANHQLNSSKDPSLLEMSALRQEASSRSYFRMTLGELTFVGVISLSDGFNRTVNMVSLLIGVILVPVW